MWDGWRRVRKGRVAHMIRERSRSQIIWRLVGHGYKLDFIPKVNSGRYCVGYLYG